MRVIWLCNIPTFHKATAVSKYAANFPLKVFNANSRQIILQTVTMHYNTLFNIM